MYFQDGNGGGHLGFAIGTSLGILSTRHQDTSYQVLSQLAFLFGRNIVQNVFSNWRWWRPSLISDQNVFIYFLFTSRPDTSYQVSSQLAFRYRGKSSRWRPKWLSWTSDRNDFSNFLSISLL